MTTEIMRKSLMRSLTDTGLRELPKVWNGTSPFIRAIAKVRKYDGSENYVLVKRIDGEYRIIKDYGSICAIHSVLEYYPYEYVEDSFIPNEVKSEAKDVKINAIEKNRPDIDKEELENKSNEELNEILTDIGAENQDAVLNGFKKKNYEKHRGK